MGWRDRIATIIARGGRSDLTTPAYHGTIHTFPAFQNQPVNRTTLSLGLGTHVARDPHLANTFADRFIYPGGHGPADYGVRGDAIPQVLPIAIPKEENFLQAVQPMFSNDATKPLWRRVASDDYAVEKMMAQEAYQRDPLMLERYLQQSRMMEPKEANRSARAMAEGGRGDVGDQDPVTLREFVGNYGGRPYNQRDREAMTEIARASWEDQGYKGLRYINTAPMEAGAPGVKDVTSYIVFDPKNIRSQFAAFDPTKKDSSNLLAGLAGTIAAPAAVATFADRFGETAAQDRYAQ